MPGSSLLERVQSLNPQVEFWSVRGVETESDYLCVRQGVLNPPSYALDKGVFVTVMQNGGMGYAATSDSSKAGLAEAFERAIEWAKMFARYPLFDAKIFPKTVAEGHYKSPIKKPYKKTSL